MDFKWFDSEKGAPSVSIASYGLTFNKAAAEEMQNPLYIRLGYNKEKKLIGVQPIYSEKESKGAFKFREKERNGYYRINSKDFVRMISKDEKKITLEKTIRFIATWDEENELLLIDLSDNEEIMNFYENKKP